jgi:hypothetical protein
MTNYLSLLLDLLNFEEEEKQSFFAIGEVMAHHTNKKLIIYHRAGFIFQAWFDLLLQHISLEEFLATGDVSSSRPFQLSASSSLQLLQSAEALENLEPGGMLLLDEISFLALSKVEQDNVQDLLEKKKILLLLC